MKFIESLSRDIENIGLRLQGGVIEDKSDVRSKTTPSDIVHQLDVDAEQMLREMFRLRIPDVPIISEESNTLDLDIENAASFVYIDPIDGSHNALLGSPLYGITAALHTDRKNIQWAVLHMPALQWTVGRSVQGSVYSDEIYISKNIPALATRQPALYLDYRVALISSYTTSVSISTNVFQQLANGGVTRIMQNWCPTFDYMLLMQNRIDACIIIDNDPVNTVAGRWICEQAGKITKKLDILWENSVIEIIITGDQNCVETITMMMKK